MAALKGKHSKYPFAHGHLASGGVKMQHGTGRRLAHFPFGLGVADKMSLMLMLEEALAGLEQEEQLDYEQCMEQAKAAVEAYDLDTAADWAKRAVFVNTSKAEAFNFIGVICELKNDRLTAQKYYRAAIALDPTYHPAHNNLERSTQLKPEGKLDIGGGEESRQGRRSRFKRKSDQRK